VAAHTPERSYVLEVTPGPGYFAIELAKLRGCRVTGISHTFVEIARRNAAETGVKVDFRHGNAASPSRMSLLIFALPGGFQKLRPASGSTSGDAPRSQTR